MLRSIRARDWEEWKRKKKYFMRCIKWASHETINDTHIYFLSSHLIYCQHSRSSFFSFFFNLLLFCFFFPFLFYIYDMKINRYNTLCIHAIDFFLWMIKRANDFNRRFFCHLIFFYFLLKLSRIVSDCVMVIGHTFELNSK